MVFQFFCHVAQLQEPGRANQPPQEEAEPESQALETGTVTWLNQSPLATSSRNFIYLWVFLFFNLLVLLEWKLHEESLCFPSMVCQTSEAGSGIPQLWHVEGHNESINPGPHWSPPEPNWQKVTSIALKALSLACSPFCMAACIPSNLLDTYLASWGGRWVPENYPVCPEETLLSSFSWGAARANHWVTKSQPFFLPNVLDSIHFSPSQLLPSTCSSGPLMSTVLWPQASCLQGCLLLAHSPHSRQARPLLSSSHLTPEVNLLRHCFLTSRFGSGVPFSHTHAPLPAAFVSCYNYLGLSCFPF